MSDLMTLTLVAHQRHTDSTCLCGWAELGMSHAWHQASKIREAYAQRNEVFADRAREWLDEHPLVEGYEPYDQAKHIEYWGLTDWRELPEPGPEMYVQQLNVWEAVHGHDVRLNCDYDECNVAHHYTHLLIRDLLAKVMDDTGA